MTNPNYSNLRIDIQYGPDDENLQSTKIDTVMEQQVDEADNIYIINVIDVVGYYINLDHYSDVYLVVIQNTHDTGFGEIDYIDDFSGANYIYDIWPGEFTIINRPQVAAGIWITAGMQEPDIDFHITIFGEKQ